MSPMSNDFIESEWWALKTIYDKGLLYKGFKIVPYCPRCGTPLSSHEVAQGYKDVKERSAVAKFTSQGRGRLSSSPGPPPLGPCPRMSRCACTPTDDYVKVQSGDGTDLLYGRGPRRLGAGRGEQTSSRDLREKNWSIANMIPLFDFVRPDQKCWYVTCDEYVTLTDGTGIVHIAPAFGEDDANVGRQYGLPFVQLVDAKGEMTKETLWPGSILQGCGQGGPQEPSMSVVCSFQPPSFEHSYPFCWRCDTPLIYYARESWFIRMTAVKEELIRNNNTIHWMPESIGKGRFGDWLENVQDWGISRNRYWGTPLNIWECSCGHRHAVGSIAELKEMSDNCPDNIELHRPYVDAVTLRCPECGGEMKRVSEVIDCWFDSGSMPFAQHHYPFENKELFERQFPADFISEAVDQTRGWFYSLLADVHSAVRQGPL